LLILANSVIRHTQVTFFTVFSAYQPPPPKLQHIRLCP